MHLIKLTFSMLVLLTAPPYVNAQPPVTSNLISSAKIDSTCSISSGNIVFGILSSPISQQSSMQNLNLKCNKSTIYKIDLAYGGVYGTGTESDGSYWEYNGSDNWYTFYYTRYSNNGKVVLERRTLTSGNNASQELGCAGFTTDRCYLGKTSYSYGKMIGQMNGDSIGYKVLIPGDVSKVWNSGVNSYTSVGTGDFQSIPLNTQIVPDQSSKSFPAPDMYFDTITATITY